MKTRTWIMKIKEVNMKTRTWINIFLASGIIWAFSPAGLKVFSEIGMMGAGCMLAWRFWGALEKFNRKIADFLFGVIVCCVSINGFIDNDYIWFFYGSLAQIYLLAFVLWNRSYHTKTEVVIKTTDTPEEAYRKAHKIVV